MIQVGAVLYGFCGGHFGRDSYSVKRVEAVGADWVVARESNGDVVVATFPAARGWTVAHLEEYTTQREAQRWDQEYEWAENNGASHDELMKILQDPSDRYSNF